MSLCLIELHGDIEGDYEIIKELPRKATNGEVLKALFPEEFKDNISTIKNAHWWIAPYKKGKENK